MFHVPPDTVEQQLELVLNVCKTVRAHIKIRKTCFCVKYFVFAVNSDNIERPQNLTPKICLK